jgi:hypothetical protein
MCMFRKHKISVQVRGVAHMKKLFLLLFLAISVSVVTGQYYDITLSFPLKETVNVTIDGSTKTVYAGEFLAQVNQNTFPAFCSDLGLTLNLGTTYRYTPIIDSALINRNLNSPSWISDIDKALGSAAWIMHQFQNETVKTDAMAAGAQLAIWECLYDSQLDFQNGRFKINGASWEATQKYNQYILGLDSRCYDYVYWQRESVGGSPQGLISDVPEPKFYGIVGIGLMGFLIFKKRKYDIVSETI